MNAFLPEGRLIHTRENQAFFTDVDTLAQAMQQHVILEGLVTRCDAGQNLHVPCGPLEGIIPRQEAALGMAEGQIRDIAVISRVGRPAAFVIEGLEANDGKLSCLLSRRRAQKLTMEHLKQLEPGTVIPATVTHLESFGAFVDIGCGITSMIPIDRISVSHIPHPRCRFQAGQEILAVYCGIDAERGHVLLSHRELLGTWLENANAFRAGETVTGRIRGIKDYGVFVELRPNLTGLADPYPGAEEDRPVCVYIKSILPEKQKLKLIIIDQLPPCPECCDLDYKIPEAGLSGWSYHSDLSASQ